MATNESLSANWPSPEADLAVHQRHLEVGMDILNDNLVLPGDGRFEIAYALLASGHDQKGSVLAIGDPGTGKTKFGDLVFGGDQRVEISRQDNDDTLYGFTNPIKASETIDGKLKGIVADDPRAYLNEISHLANTGALHRLWDIEKVDINGETVPIRDIALYLTSNFPDGTPRVHELDEALMSRVAMEMLTGDYDRDTAVAIQGFSPVKSKDASQTPLLPPAAARRAIYEKLAARLPVNEAQGKKVGSYVVNVIGNLNRTGLIFPISIGDARTSEAFYEVARARMLYEGINDDSKLGLREIANVAALVLPGSIKLSRVALGRLREELGGGRRLTAIEQAIATRRLVARIAFATLFQGEVRGPSDTRQLPGTIRGAIEQYSYANPNAMDFDTDAVIFGKNEIEIEYDEVTDEPVEPAAKTELFDQDALKADKGEAKRDWRTILRRSSGSS